MKKFLIGLFVLLGVCVASAGPTYPIPTYKDGGKFYMASYRNHQSGCSEYYLVTQRNKSEVTLSIHYTIPEFAKADFAKFKNSKVLSTCTVSTDYNDMIIFVKYNEPRNGKTHGFYLADYGKDTKFDGTHHILDFTPERAVVTKEVVKYVTNTVSTATSSTEVSPASDGKYNNINFNFHN